MEVSAQSESGDAPPSVLFEELLSDVAMLDVISPKDWADATPKTSPERILEAYRKQAPATPSAVLEFVLKWFDLPESTGATRQGDTVASHIEATWSALIRPPLLRRAADSLLSLPAPSLAPGGRFRECYYWDTFFTLLGLRDRPDLIRASADNFRTLIERYGFVPNANRTYYLSRSQPPLFFKIVEWLAEVEGTDIVAEYLPALVAEHRFWMEGADALATAGAHRRVVKMPDGGLLNRNWDDRAAPRDEAYRADLAAAASATGRAREDVYRDIRAGCESGWDFSSRWLGAAGDFTSIMTTSIVPIDLNSVLFGLERFIARALRSQGSASGAEHYDGLAARRRQSMCRYLWNDAIGAFDDFDWKRAQLRGAITAATTAPLFFGVASDDQAKTTATLVQSKLLAPGGVLTTTERTELQWDAPNGWAPLQWIATEGLARYGFADLAAEIRQRWLSTVDAVFRETGRLFEKYDVVRKQPGGGGEYEVQDGFGWTNGVTKAFRESAMEANTAAIIVETGKVDADAIRV